MLTPSRNKRRRQAIHGRFSRFTPLCGGSFIAYDGLLWLFQLSIFNFVDFCPESFQFFVIRLWLCEFC